MNGIHAAFGLANFDRAIYTYDCRYTLPEVLNHRRLSSRASHTGYVHSHPHIVEFKRVFLTPRTVCIVMEYAEGGDLASLIISRGGRLTEQSARFFFQQIILGKLGVGQDFVPT